MDDFRTRVHRQQHRGRADRRAVSAPSERLAGIVCITESPDIGQSVNGPVQADTPVVVIGMNYQAANYDVLSVDERIGIRTAVSHLISLGHERIAFVGGLYSMQRMRFL